MSDQEHEGPKPGRHGRVNLQLPDAHDLAGVDAAEMAVIRAAAQGEISSRVALDFTTMLEHRRRVISDRVIDDRMDAIDAENKRRAKAARDRRWEFKP